MNWEALQKQFDRVPYLDPKLKCPIWADADAMNAEASRLYRESGGDDEC